MTVDAFHSTTGYRRRNAGRGHSYYGPDGDKLDGVTTVLRDGVPKPAFVEAAARKVAEWVGDFYDDLVNLTPSKRTKAALDYYKEHRFDAATRGQIIHEHAAELLVDAEVEVHPDDVPIVATFLRFADEWNLDPIAVEAMVVSERWHYMGTLDCLARVGAHGNVVALLDWKTGATGVWPEAAMQLAAYRNADFYVDVEGKEIPMPKVDLVACVWLQDDRYDVVPVDAGPRTFGAFLNAQEVAHFTRRARSELVLDAIRP